MAFMVFMLQGLLMGRAKGFNDEISALHGLAVS